MQDREPPGMNLGSGKMSPHHRDALHNVRCIGKRLGIPIHSTMYMYCGLVCHRLETDGGVEITFLYMRAKIGQPEYMCQEQYPVLRNREMSAGNKHWQTLQSRGLRTVIAATFVALCHSRDPRPGVGREQCFSVCVQPPFCGRVSRVGWSGDHNASHRPGSSRQRTDAFNLPARPQRQPSS